MAQRHSVTGEVRDSLLRRVEAVRVAAMARATRGATPHPADARTDFAALSQLKELRFYHRVGERCGVKSPYFRLHEGRAGPETRIDGRQLLNFASYDYLGLNGHPEIIAAAHAAIDQYGVSSSASRCVAGERPVHRRLERAIAEHYGVEDSAVFVSGYATNVSVIGQLVGAKDLVVLDSVIHNSAIMGGVLSGANRRSFPHNDLAALDALLHEARAKFDRALIVVEGLYSMDGDYPDLPKLIGIKKRHDAWLMVDEAHSIGVLGETGHGIYEHFGVDAREVDIWMGTLSKTLASCGGYIAGSRDLIDYIKNFAGAFAYSVAIPPVIAAAAEKALELLHREPERVRRLQQNAALFSRMAKERGLHTGTGAATAVAPIMIGDSLPAVILSDRLFERGINVMPVLYPAVPAKTSRLRFFLTALHAERDIVAALDATAEELANVRRQMRRFRAPRADQLPGAEE
jgi:8-amino-7-oxononanoate synthase